MTKKINKVNKFYFRGTTNRIITLLFSTSLGRKLVYYADLRKPHDLKSSGIIHFSVIPASLYIRQLVPDRTKAVHFVPGRSVHSVPHSFNPLAVLTSNVLAESGASQLEADTILPFVVHDIVRADCRSEMKPHRALPLGMA